MRAEEDAKQAEAAAKAKAEAEAQRHSEAPAKAKAAASDARPPLKLVAEQRVDRTAEAPVTTAPDAPTPTPVPPRRIRADMRADAAPKNADLAPEGGNFNEFVEKRARQSFQTFSKLLLIWNLLRARNNSRARNS